MADRSPTLMNAAKQAFETFPFFKKLIFGAQVIFMFAFFSMHMIVLKLRKKKNSDLVQIMDNIYVVHGSSGFVENTMVAIQGRDGSVLLWNVRAPQNHTCEQLKSIGPVKYIVVPTIFHDTFAKSWKSKYPDAKVLCHSSDTKEMEKAVSIDSNIEDEPLILNTYGIARIYDASAFLRVKESVIEISTLGNGRRILLIADLMSNQPFIFSVGGLLSWIGGFIGLGVFRQFSLMFVTNTKGLKDFLVYHAKGKDGILFAHGNPLTGDVYTKVSAALANYS